MIKARILIPHIHIQGISNRAKGVSISLFSYFSRRYVMTDTEYKVALKECLVAALVSAVFFYTFVILAVIYDVH